MLQQSEFKFRLFFPKSYPFIAPQIYLIENKCSPTTDFTGLSTVIEAGTGRVNIPIFDEGWNPVLDFSMIVFELEMLLKTGPSSRERSALHVQDLYYDKVRELKNESKNKHNSLYFSNFESSTASHQSPTKD